MNSVQPAGHPPASALPSAAAVSTLTTDRLSRSDGHSPRPQSEAGVHATLALWAQTSEQSLSLNQLVWAESELHQVGGWVARHERLTTNPQAANTPLQQALQQQLQATDARLQQGQSPLTVDLTYGPNQPAPKVFINHLPLLQTKARDEQVQIFIPGKVPLQVPLPAEASTDALLQQLQYRFKPLGVTAEIQPNWSEDGQAAQLRFSAPAHHQGIFFQPWQISGEGVRVAAGNPLIAPLQNAHSPLHHLVKSASPTEENREVQQKQHFSILQKIKHTLKQVRDTLTQETQQIEPRFVAFKDNSEAIAVSEKVKQMGQTHSQGAWVFSHKQIHRKVVEYSLA